MAETIAASLRRLRLRRHQHDSLETDPIDLVSATLLLFLIMDPLGNVPIFLSILKDIEPRRRLFIIVREKVIALGVLLILLYFGKNTLDTLGLRSESIASLEASSCSSLPSRCCFPAQRRCMTIRSMASR